MTDEIKTLRQAEMELERRRREDPLKHVYEPHTFQEEIHRSRAAVTCVLGGNRTGKTYAAIAEAILYALGRSTYAEVPEPPNTVWYVVPTSSVFKDAVEPILEELMPWGRVQHHNKKYKRYKFDNGSVLVIKSSDQRQKRLVAAAVDLVVADEPMPKPVYEELMARLISTGGRMLMVLTPVSEKIDEWLWVRDELYVPWQVGERSDVDVIHMPVLDQDGEPAVPHLTKAQVDQMARQYPDPETRAARMYGEFIVRGGLVFKGLEEDVNVIERFDIPHHWHSWLVCDPQYHRFAVLYFAADDRGNYYVTDEYFSSDEPMARRAERIKALVGAQDRHIPMYVDYANPQDIQELNYHFNRLSVDVGAVQLPEQKRVEKMILRVHAMLEPDPDRPYHPATGRGDVYGAPRLMIFNDLQSTWEHEGRHVRGSRLLWELKRLTWGNRNKPDKDTAGGGDCTDCYDDQTEVLTRSGWKFFKDVEVGPQGDEFATVNLDKDEIEYQRASEKIEKDWDGDLVAIDGHAINLRVTPRHRMVVEKGGRTYIRRAEDLAQHHALKLRSHWAGDPAWKPMTIPACYQDRAGGNGGQGGLISPETTPGPEDLAAFFGWYVAEGSVFEGRTKTQGQVCRRVHISQSATKHHEEIRDLLDRLPWGWHQTTAGFVITNKQAFELVRVCGAGAENKRVPQWVKDAPPKIIEAFLDAAISGDGWTQSGVRRYATISQRLADDMQELFIKVGKVASVIEREETTWNIKGRSGYQKKQYHVCEQKSSRRWLTNRRGDEVKSLISREPYQGKVYCVSVPNETLIVRRDGQMLICGNCLIYGCSIQAIGRPPDDQDNWREGLSERDQTLWDAIERQNRRQDIGIQFPE